jgi:DNA-3-methyladenine glycosylase
MLHAGISGNWRSMTGVFAPPGIGFYGVSARELAPRLIGCVLVRKMPGGDASGLIVETEAYASDDPASHSFRGMTKRNAPMFRGGGLAYVYFIYGMHCCFNVTAGPPGCGEAVLIRALEPLEGIDRMRRNSPGVPDGRLCRGPGRICRSLAIGTGVSGLPLGGEIALLVPQDPPAHRVASGRRIGISSGLERPWRFVLEGSGWLSRPV